MKVIIIIICDNLLSLLDMQFNQRIYVNFNQQNVSFFHLCSLETFKVMYSRLFYSNTVLKKCSNMLNRIKVRAIF